MQTQDLVLKYINNTLTEQDINNFKASLPKDIIDVDSPAALEALLQGIAIEAYHSNQLPEAERLVFEAYCTQDANLQQQLQDYQNAQVLLATNRLADVNFSINAETQQTVKRIQASKAPHTKPSKPIIRRLIRFAIAAAVLLFISIVSVIALRQNYSNKAIVEHQFEPMGIPVSLKGIVLLRGFNNTTQESAFSKGLVAYNQQDFGKAIDYLQHIPPDDEYYQEAYLYLGNSFLIGQRYPEAIDALQTALNVKNSLLTDDIQWYLSIAYLANADQNNAIPQLQTLLDNKDADKLYQQKAKMTLQTLKHPWRQLPLVR